MNMTRQLKRAFALVSLVLPLWAEAVTAFDVAESVWPAGLEAEMNTLIAFRAPFDAQCVEILHPYAARTLHSAAARIRSRIARVVR